LEEDILKAKDNIANVPEIKAIEYVSKEQAKETFVKKHENDPNLIAAVEEVGGNPFLASLNISAFEASQYTAIASLLESSNFKDLIEKVDYYQRKPIIERIFSLTSLLNKSGIIFSIILRLYQNTLHDYLLLPKLESLSRELAFSESYLIFPNLLFLLSIFPNFHRPSHALPCLPLLRFSQTLYCAETSIRFVLAKTVMFKIMPPFIWQINMALWWVMV